MRGRVRDPAVTSRMMAAVHNKDSKAEWALRRALHSAGVRYRLHPKNITGRPDIAIRRRRLAVFVDGDFWHGVAWKSRGLNRLEDLFPSRTAWWVAKIQRNVERDREVTQRLKDEGWTVMRFWESEVLASPGVAARQILDALRQPEGSTTGTRRI